MFADAEYSELVEKGLEMALAFVRQKRAEGLSLLPVERTDAPYMYTLRDPFKVAIGDGASRREAFATIFFAGSPDEDAIDALAELLARTFDLS